VEPDLSIGLRWALDRLNDASGETYRIETHTDFAPRITYSIYRRLPGGTWVTIRARLDEAWALDILTVFMPRPAHPPRLPVVVEPLTDEELDASMIVEFYAIVKYFNRAEEESNPDDEVCISLQSEERDHAARIIEGDCALPFAYFPGETEGQVRLSHSFANSPEAWYIA